jgi:c-di-GMP-binding flagellar brake protein YcgR
MAMVTVTPVIGTVRMSRLDSYSLGGCHALHERAVTKPFNGQEELGDAIVAALHDIAVLQRHLRDVRDWSYIMAFNFKE